jgi:DNA-binding transcriptional LysR family regulator
MNITSLRTFLAVVETGSLIAASKQMNVTQSTITARLHALEDDLGQKLLMRQKSGATMTASGLKFKRYAVVMTELWRQAKQETSLPDGMTAMCNIGCQLDLWPRIGHEFFNDINNRHPDVAVTAWPATQTDIERWLGAGVIDLALGYQPSVQAGQTNLVLGEDKLVLVGDRPDRPARFDDGYIYVDAGEAFGRDHAAAYADAGVARISFGSAKWALEHLLDQGGSAYLPLRLTAHHLHEGRLFRLADAPQFNRRIMLIMSDASTRHWPWLDAVVERLKISFQERPELE